jgi:hypothetical protein
LVSFSSVSAKTPRARNEKKDDKLEVIDRRGKSRKRREEASV